MASIRLAQVMLIQTAIDTDWLENLPHALHRHINYIGLSIGSDPTRGETVAVNTIMAEPG